MSLGVGTERYAAPELSRGGPGPVPFKSDIYSLGIILHIMLTKDVPNFETNVKPGRFVISNIYSDEIIALLTLLLKEEPRERPSIK